MLRLTRMPDRSGATLLKAEGQIVAEWVTLLETECLELIREQQQVTLDLGGVSYVDRRGVRLLGELTRHGTLSLVRCPPLVAQLLTEEEAAG
jgi:anti-anti-sigma regulatory factor